MLVPQKKFIRRVVFTLAAIGLLVPVTVSPSQGIQGNEACADDSCCREMNSVCMSEDGNVLHHYKSSGGCQTAVQ